MTSRTKYHVVSRDRGRWAVIKDNAGRASSTHRKKSAAVRNAKRLAKKNKPSSVVIHNRNGVISDKHSYGNDPRRIRG